MIVYVAELLVVQSKDYSSNFIANNTLSQVDSDGFSTTLMESIIYHQKDEVLAILKCDKYIITKIVQQ